MFQSGDPKIKAMQAELRATLNATKEDAFNEFMEMPHVRFMLSLIPQPDNPDTMRSLLRSTFDAAFQSGTAATMCIMLDKWVDQISAEQKRRGGA